MKSPVNIDLESLPRIIRVRRRELGLTQRELGQLLGIDQRTVSALEKNPHSISVSRFFAVLDALEIKVTGNCTRMGSESAHMLTVDQFFKNSQII